MILPLVSGVRTFHYPTPLHYRIVPALIYDTDATICFGTDTFLNGWARYAHPYDFRAMRYIFAGAEKVREETRHLFADRFGVRVLEGYGATETSPVLALNTAMQCRPGTVGRFMPGIDWRLEPVAGIETGGRLHVRGPNVMLGLSARDGARCGGTAGGRLVRHRRHRVGGWRGVRHDRRPGEAVRQDRRRDGVDGGCRSAGGIAVAGGAARGDQSARSAQGRIAAAGDNAAGRGQPGDPCGRKSADDSRDHGAARGAVRAVGSAAGHRQGRLSRRCSVWPKTHVPARRRKPFQPELPSHSEFRPSQRTFVSSRAPPLAKRGAKRSVSTGPRIAVTSTSTRTTLSMRSSSSR